MPRLQYKSFASPDEVRTFPNGQAEVVRLDESVIGHAVYEPGWRWSTAMPAIAGTDHCQLHHLGLLHLRRDACGHGRRPGDRHPSGFVYEIPPGHDAWVVGDDPWVTVEWTSARIFGLAPDRPGEGVVVTVLFTDIVDSTATLQRMGDTAWRDLLFIHNTRLRDQLNIFRGREVKTTGDGFLAVFDSATRAVRCGAAMALTARKIGLPIRVGVHTGEVEFVGNDARGLAVHAAARVMSVGGPDEVLVSSTTYDLLEGSGLNLEEAGTHEMKGLPGARKVFRLVQGAP